MAITAATLAAAAAATVSALLRGVSDDDDENAADSVSRALADVQARCHVEDGSPPEGAAFERCLAHARAFMDAGAPDALAQLSVGAAAAPNHNDDTLSRRQVLSALRSLFAPAARLRGRTPAVAAQAGAALGAFAARGGVSATAALLSHDNVGAATAAADALQVILYASGNAAPAAALAPLCAPKALTQMLSLAGGTATFAGVRVDADGWNCMFASLLLLLTLLSHSALGHDVAARLTAPEEVLAGGAVPLLLALATGAQAHAASIAADVLRWLLAKLDAAPRAARARALIDVALPLLAEQLRKANVGVSYLLGLVLLRELVPIADAGLVPGGVRADAPLPRSMLRHVMTLRDMCACASVAGNNAAAAQRAVAGLAATMPGARVLRTFAAQSALAGAQLLPPDAFKLAHAQPLTRQELAAAQRAQAAWSADACAAEEATTPAQDAAAAAASSAAPLLAASRNAAAQPRVRMAAARANVMARYCLLHARRGDDAHGRHDWLRLLAHHGRARLFCHVCAHRRHRAYHCARRAGAGGCRWPPQRAWRAA
jgi:hypothetical protein